jgi:hypothetical protein
VTTGVIRPVVTNTTPIRRPVVLPKTSGVTVTVTTTTKKKKPVLPRYTVPSVYSPRRSYTWPRIVTYPPTVKREIFTYQTNAPTAQRKYVPITSVSTVMGSFYNVPYYPSRGKTLFPVLEPTFGKREILSPERKTSTVGMSETVLLVSTTNFPSAAIANVSAKEDYYGSFVSSVVIDIFIMILIIPIIVAIILLARYLRQLKKFQGILNRNMMGQRSSNLPSNQHELVEFINGQLHEILCQRQRGPNATYAMNPEQLLLVPKVTKISSIVDYI